MVLHTVNENLREKRGRVIFQKGSEVERIRENVNRVNSQSGNGTYDVTLTNSGWVCSCPDHVYRGVKCKHIFGIEFSLRLRKEVGVKRITPINNISTCMHEKGEVNGYR